MFEPSTNFNKQFDEVGKDASLTTKEETSIWKIVECLLKQDFSDIGLYAVLILNRPINIPEQLLCNLWNGACFRGTADGGTDQWYNFVSKMRDKSKLNQIHPDLVTGDFDSIRPETLQYCKGNGVNIVRTPNQDKTDFQKSLEEILVHSKDNIDCIIAVVENSGRLDHIMSNLDIMYTEVTASRSLFLLASDSITWLLKPGSHKILIPQQLVEAQATCGLIPLGAPCVVSTSGLKWNLNNTKMAFGKLISTCNTYSNDCQGVTVQTDSSLLWTANLASNEH